MNIMASVYVLHHYEDFYALVDSAYLLEETTHWSLMSWTLEEQILWTKEDYGG